MATAHKGLTGGMVSNGGQTVQCPICKEPYKVYSHYAGDQSACPACRAKAEKNSGVNPWRPR